MPNMVPLGNIILTCSGSKNNNVSSVEGISVATFANVESTINILRYTADLLEKGDINISQL